MSCYHPNIIILQENGIIKKDGTKGYKTSFIPWTSKQYEHYINWNKNNSESTYQYENNQKTKFILAPCGMCQGCKTDRRKEWAIRLEKESKYYDHNYFLTLTYDDSNIIIPKYWAMSETGEVIYNPGTWRGTLSKYHCERFIRSLKEHFRTKYNHTGMKYYIVGEYASRPHYHAILLNCPEIPLEVIGKNKQGQTYYTNEKIAKIWNKGFITIGNVTWDSISYVAGYVNKKRFGKKAIHDHDILGRIPEFAHMSNGIGKKYYEENREKIYENDEIINAKGQSLKPPVYYDRLLEKDDPELLRAIKQKREKISAYETDKKIKTISLPLRDQLKNEEVIAEDKQTIYNRSRIK